MYTVSTRYGEQLCMVQGTKSWETNVKRHTSCIMMYERKQNLQSPRRQHTIVRRLRTENQSIIIIIIMSSLEFLPSQCSVVLPSMVVWKESLGLHVTLILCVQAPLAYFLYYFLLPDKDVQTKKTTTTIHTTTTTVTTARKIVGTILALMVLASGPLLTLFYFVPTLDDLSSTSSSKHHWMTPFLLSTFGFSCFFKTMAVTYNLQPAGLVECQNFESFCVWFMSFPEPEINKDNGSLVLLRQGELQNQLWILLQRMVSLSVILSILLHNDYPFGSSSTTDNWNLWDVTEYLNASLYLWLIYAFASYCLEVGAILVSIQGYKSGRTFDNPLLGSRTYKECWGIRWNVPVHVLLKRTVYKPILQYYYWRCHRKHQEEDDTKDTSLPPPTGVVWIASLLTFGASGLLHEYNFFIHNHAGYQPGHALLFFYYVGGLMMGEELLLSKISSKSPHLLFQKMPTPLLAILLQIPVLPLFSHLFVKSWIVSGMVQSLGDMIPTIQCK